ncbi:MAG: ATP-binding protein, partial [Bacteroidota bacterium]
MRSPFKFLDAYTREDRDQFFGREEETAQLYETVNQNRLVLVYGPSGTGKTSLIQCGLGNRFEATDWLPIFIRRGNHLPTALQQSLEQQADDKLEGAFWEAADENPLIELIEDLFAEYLRPVYLIFDQFEEIFVLGNAEEQATFFQAMADIYAAKMPCRLLFVMREEYLAHLYEFEQKIPSLFKRRLRVETMSAQQASEVVRQSCGRFNITLESPEDNPLQIVNKITEGRSGVALPYLQVYLDRLYREDLTRTYPQGVPASPNDWPALEFTSAEIEEFGEIGDVLKNFLQEQSQQIQDDLPDLPERAVRKVLNSFASLQGTKIPQLRAEMKLAPLTDPQIDQILQRLQQARILREAEGRYELAHDTLAGEIAGQRDGQERALLEITELIRNRARAFARTKTYLESRELELIANYEGALREEQKLKEAEWDFIQRS